MWNILIETSLILGILVISILFFFQRKNRNRNNYFLILTLTAALYSLFINNLNATRKILEFPGLIRTGNISAYLIFPFLYLFTRNSFYPGKFWQKKDFLFLVPAIIYVFDMFFFFFSDPDYKISIMKANLEYPERMFQVAEGWISVKGFHFIFRYLWSVGIMILLIRLIYRNRQVDKNRKGSPNRPFFWFIIILNFLHLPLIIPGIFGAIFHLSWFSLNYMNVSLALVIITTTVFIFFSPMILYGFLPVFDVPVPIQTNNEKTQKATVVEVKPTSDIPKHLSADVNTKALIERLDAFMAIEKPYTNQYYTIHDLSNDIDIPVYQLSPIINNHYQCNFNSWLNKYRVDHFIKISETGIKKELTLDAIAREAGFTNRTTFTSAFKKEKGTTPGQFVKSLHFKH